jgi:SAM-dependent methyltransferase
MNPASHPEPAHKREAPDRQSLEEYYQRLAPDYDAARFENSYGQYLDLQERRCLTRWLKPFQGGAILDLACGTGRLLDLATHGFDRSDAMLREARRKYPSKPLHCVPAQEMARPGIRFDAVFCLHLFMHLPPEEIETIVQACEPCVRRGGVLIADAPSAWRRSLNRFQPAGWHGATSLTANRMSALAGAGWRLRQARGLLFFPVHRIPARVRPWFRPVDDLLGATPLKWFSSYTLYCLERQ